MEYLKIAGAVLAGFFAWNIWTRLKWACGFKPMLYDESQAKIAAKEQARHYANSARKQAEDRGETMPDEDYENWYLNMANFGMYVILNYVRLMELPKLDLMRDPVQANHVAPTG
jgi:hypothetical protein